ncbi:zinc ribbon domain-containing protein [Cellulomonas sp. S1-8]|uniref:zinc ribbon domain-containing protein n=1 Tax=Cellulomonas sp. S1-8 TaxID=2904790 RepID=UPI002243CCDE|nr:C4-type zinc ribbon domain-containing protein [Cellulomonas sp. S1-8]UZN01729.1 C4-type zinc ribbon domain-containing protein [Cellulomonas sp. S1-8]
MTSAPAADQRRLLDVQDLDTRLAQLAHKRRTLPALARLVELDARLADLETALVTSRTAASDLRTELTKAEADVTQVRSRATRDQQRLDGGQVGAKDAQALTSELASLAARQAHLEDIELEVMERLEAHEGALQGLDQARAALVADRDQVVAERDAGFAEIDAEAGRVRAERERAADGLDSGLTALYERLRGQLGGSGAAALRGNRCEGCRLELNPLDLEAIRARAVDAVVRCEECGRILVRLTDS